jgi:UTP:GlnB (protein PII) uridylyltransferase
MLALELRQVRRLLDRERKQLRQRLEAGAPTAEIVRAQARLLDGTVIGLCHLARMADPRPAGMAPPLAVIARGNYGRRALSPDASADLLFLVAADPVGLERGLAIAQFAAGELAGLGWRLAVAKRPVRGCLAEAHLDPAIAADLSAARLVWGCEALAAELRAGLASAMCHRPALMARRTPERSGGLALAA